MGGPSDMHEISSDLEKRPESPEASFEKKELRFFPTRILLPVGSLLLGFWFVAVWIFGSTYKQQQKSRNLEVLVANFDGKEIGECLLAASTAISGISQMVSFVPAPDSSISYDDIYELVWRGHYWGAIISMPNATDYFLDAVQNGVQQSQDSVRYVWNEARWITVAESYVLPSLTAAISGLNDCYASNITAPLLANNTLSLPSTRVLLSGVPANSINIQPFEIGMRPFLNTVGMVFPILIEFFFAMAMGGIGAIFKWYRPDRILSRYLNRFLLSLFFSCVIGISWGLWLEIYREDFDLTGGQYCKIWLIYWMYGLIAFEVLDTAASFVPVPFLPLCVLTYVIVNVGGSVFPIDIKPAFYHLDYIWPSYNCFELLITVLSHGSTSRVYRNVPVLFGWLVVWMPLGFMANRRRCRMSQ